MYVSSGARFRLLPLVVGFMVLMLLGLLSGCAATVDGLSGAWAHVDGKHRTILQLKSDKTFTVTNIPAAVFDTQNRLGRDALALDWSDTEDLTGTWGLNKNGSVEFDIDTSDSYSGFHTSLSTNGIGNATDLIVNVGPIDVGQTFTFRRK